jgi:hypothetical protein
LHAGCTDPQKKTAELVEAVNSFTDLAQGLLLTPTALSKIVRVLHRLSSADRKWLAAKLIEEGAGEGEAKKALFRYGISSPTKDEQCQP